MASGLARMGLAAAASIQASICRPSVAGSPGYQDPAHAAGRVVGEAAWISAEPPSASRSNNQATAGGPSVKR